MISWLFKTAANFLLCIAFLCIDGIELYATEISRTPITINLLQDNASTTQIAVGANSHSKLYNSKPEESEVLKATEAEDELRLSIRSKSNISAEIMITDVHGVQMFHQRMNMSKGINMFQIKTSEMPKGHYIITYDDGYKPISKKIFLFK